MASKQVQPDDVLKDLLENQPKEKKTANKPAVKKPRRKVDVFTKDNGSSLNVWVDPDIHRAVSLRKMMSDDENENTSAKIVSTALEKHLAEELEQIRGMRSGV